uniref:DNA-directed RNA polymerase III subunit RPC6 n=1 Tax=Rhizophora mucronata TaxID=61149 RepID=A0A2P2IWC7_RHIMU
MSRSQGPTSLKRKRPESKSLDQSMTEHERVIYEAIRAKQDMGIWTRDLKKETNIPDNMVNKSLKALQLKNLIKEVVNIQGKGKKHYMAAEFEPSKEITGGAWYDVDGNIDTEFIRTFKECCVKQISRLKIATLEKVTDSIKGSGLFKEEPTKLEIEQILRALVLDNEIMEVKSNGRGEFASISVGKLCYKYNTKTSSKIGAMASIPCGVCPRISQCTPDGIISPTTCVYYSKWLDF